MFVFMIFQASRNIQTEYLYVYLLQKMSTLITSSPFGLLFSIQHVLIHTAYTTSSSKILQDIITYLRPLITNTSNSTQRPHLPSPVFRSLLPFQVAPCGLSLSGTSAASCGDDERLSPCSSVGGASSGASSRLGGCINIVTVPASPAKVQLRTHHSVSHSGGSQHSISPVSQQSHLADGSSSASNSNCNTLDKEWRRLSIEALTAGGGGSSGHGGRDSLDNSKELKELQQLQGQLGQQHQHDNDVVAASMAAAGGATALGEAGSRAGLNSGGGMTTGGPLHATSLHSLHGMHAGSSAGSGRLSQASSCAPSLQSAQSGHSGMSRGSGDRDRISQQAQSDDPHELALKVLASSCSPAQFC